MYIPLSSYSDDFFDQEEEQSSARSSSPLRPSVRKESGSIVINIGSSASGTGAVRIEDLPSSPRKRTNIFNNQNHQGRDDIEAPLMMNDENRTKHSSRSNSNAGGSRGVSGPMAFPPPDMTTTMTPASTAAVSMVEADEPIGFWARLFGQKPPVSRTISLECMSHNMCVYLISILLDGRRRQKGGDYPPNKIRNQKYRAWSFIFVVLFNQVLKHT